MNALLNTDDLLKWTGIKDINTLTSFLNRLNVPYATVKNGNIVSTLASVQTAFEKQEIGQQVEIIRIEEVVKLVKLSRASIYLKLKDGSFPPKVKLGKKAIGWKKIEVLQWLEGKHDWPIEIGE